MKISAPETHSRGNVLFIILIAIVLFAALNFTFMQSQGDTGDFERAKIHAGEILRYAQQMRQTIDQMRADGVSETELRFAHPDLNSTYGTFGTTPEHEVFHPDGGGMRYIAPKEEWLDSSFSAQSQYGEWRFSAHNSVDGLGETCTTDQSCVELTMILPFLKEAVCRSINTLLGIGNEETTPQLDNGSFGLDQLFNGTFPSSSLSLAPLDLDYQGFETYCIAGAGTPPANSYHFYQVLIVR